VSGVALLLRLPVLALVLFSAACGAGPAGPPPPEATGVAAPAGVLSIGSVSISPGREHEVVQPFGDYLAARLAAVGIGRCRVVVVDSLHSMIAELDAGRVDLYLDSPFPVAFAVAHEADLTVLARRWKRGRDEYRSVVFVRGDSRVDTLEDLRGKVVAFGIPFSTAGFLMPKAALAAAGLELVPFQDPAASVDSGNVGYVFSNDAENTVFWVLEGKAAAGAVNEDYYRVLAGPRLGELKVLLRTPALPRNIVCARSSLDPRVKEAVVEVLLAMEGDAEGRAVMEAFENTLRFDLFPNGAEQALNEVFDMLPYVEEDLGR
jgi:phosphonate transport system substrate-binding protein